MKLTKRLTIIFFLMSILPITAVGILAFQNGQMAIESNVTTHVMTTTVYKQDEFLRWIDNNQDKLIILAQRPLVRKYAAILVSSDSSLLAYQAAYNQLLVDHLTPNLRDGSFLNFSIIRPSDGKILISTEKSLAGKYREREPYFLEGQHGTFIDEVRYFPSENGIALHIGTPILDDQGVLVAVLIGHVNLDTMTEIMQQGKELLQGEETYLVNRAFFFVTEPWLGTGKALKNTVRTEGVAACLEGQTGIAKYNDYQDIPVLGAYRWIDERNLCVITELNQQIAFKPVIDLRNQILSLGLFSALYHGKYRIHGCQVDHQTSGSADERRSGNRKRQPGCSSCRPVQ